MGKAEAYDQRTRITKLLIRNSFLDLMKQKPVQRITVRELCEKAQLNRSTFYTYYLDIYDLLQNIEQDLVDEFDKALSLEIFGWKDYSTINICKNILKVLDKNSDLCEVLLGPTGDYGIVERITDIGKKFFIRAYAYRYPGIDVDTLERHYIFISSGAIALVKNQLYSHPHESFESFGEQFGNLIDVYVSNIDRILSERGENR